MGKRRVNLLQIKLVKQLTSTQSDWLFVCCSILCRVSPERDADSIVLDDDVTTDRSAGQLHREQEMEEPTANNEQSTEQQQQQQQEEEEDEERKHFSSSSLANTLTYCLIVMPQMQLTSSFIIQNLDFILVLHGQFLALTHQVCSSFQ